MRVWLAAACAGLALMAAPEAGAVDLSVIYAGTVETGTDAAGLFGAPGTDLSGEAFTVKLDFDTSLGDLKIFNGFQILTGATGSLAGQPLTLASLTISGISQDFDLSSVSSESKIQRVLSTNADQLDSVVFSSLNGPGEGLFLYDSCNCSFVDHGSAGASLSTPGPEIGGFSLLGDGGSLKILSSQIDPPPPLVSVVPEPASWAVMLFGLGGLGSILRRTASRSCLPT